jgi:hypothetical protein
VQTARGDTSERAEGEAGEEVMCGTSGRGRGKMGMCDCCREQAAKYRCPGCDAVTCSLACSKAHKIDVKCSGKRNRTEFIPTAQLTDRNIVSGTWARAFLRACYLLCITKQF